MQKLNISRINQANGIALFLYPEGFDDLYGYKVINEPAEICRGNGDFKGSTGGKCCRCHRDNRFQLHHLVINPGKRIRNLYFLFVPKVNIKQKSGESLDDYRNGIAETVLLDCRINAPFYARMQSRTQN